MGFLDNGNGSKPAIDGSAAYLMLVAGDLPGAWALLSDADLSATSDVIYNKALCLRAAGRSQEALELASLAFRRLTEGVPQKTLDPVTSALVASMFGPVPMGPAVQRANPTYAGILARWLYCLCLSDCGELEELSRASAPLERLWIKPVPEKE